MQVPADVLYWGDEASVARTIGRPSWRSRDKYFSTFDQKTKRSFNCKILSFLFIRSLNRDLLRIRIRTYIYLKYWIWIRIETHADPLHC